MFGLALFPFLFSLLLVLGDHEHDTMGQNDAQHARFSLGDGRRSVA